MAKSTNPFRYFDSSPGWIMTKGTGVFLERIQTANGGTIEDARQFVLGGLGGISIGRGAEPLEVAQAIAFLAWIAHPRSMVRNSSSMAGPFRRSEDGTIRPVAHVAPKRLSWTACRRRLRRLSSSQARSVSDRRRPACVLRVLIPCCMSSSLARRQAAHPLTVLSWFGLSQGGDPIPAVERRAVASHCRRVLDASHRR